MSISQAVLKGGIGFCVVSLLVFATVAFGERWMYMRLGVLGAYVVWTLAFILLGGAGSVLITIVFALGFGAMPLIPKLSLLLFLGAGISALLATFRAEENCHKEAQKQIQT